MKPSLPLKPSRLHAFTFCFFVVLAAAVPAAAQVTALGSSNAGPARNGRWSDVAYDDKHDIYLVVWDDFTSVIGRFYLFDGTPAGSAFTIGASSNVYRGSLRVVYTRSSVVDEFAVLFTDAQTGRACARRLRYTGAAPTGGVFLASQVTVSPSSAGATFANDLIFNGATLGYIVAWECTGVTVSTSSLAGSSPGPGIDVSPAGGRLARLSFDWQSSRYNVSYVVGSGGTDEARVLTSTLQPQTPWHSRSTTTGTPGYAEGSAFLPESGNFISAWTGPSIATQSVDVFSETGPQPATAFQVPIALSGLDRYSALDYDAYSRRVFIVAPSTASNSTSVADLAGALLDGAGQPIGSAFPLPGGPRTDASAVSVRATRGGQFAVSYLRNGEVWLDRFSVPAAVSPGPRFSRVRVTWTTPQVDPNKPAPFLLQGSAIDLGQTASDSTAGIDTVHVWAFPQGGGGGIFLGEDISFDDRTDVAASFGSQFLKSGFAINAAALPEGTYGIVAYPHSLVTGTFGPGTAISVTMPNPRRLSLDSPVHLSTIQTGFVLDGWAADLSATSSPGVNTIHVYAFPGTGAAPIFLGVPEATTRTDLAAQYGSQFLNAGYRIPSVVLPPGMYHLRVYVQFASTGTFVGTTQVTTITVTARQPNPAMALDGPLNNSTISQPFLTGGWAVDLGALTGSGVDTVHVWAFPIVNGVVGAGQFVAQGTTAGSRPDVGAVYGSQFTNSGYTFTIGTLAPGTYILGVYARSTVSGTFNQVKFVTLTVQ